MRRAKEELDVLMNTGQRSFHRRNTNSLPSVVVHELTVGVGALHPLSFAQDQIQQCHTKLDKQSRERERECRGAKRERY